MSVVRMLILTCDESINNWASQTNTHIQADVREKRKAHSMKAVHTECSLCLFCNFWLLQSAPTVLNGNPIGCLSFLCVSCTFWIQSFSLLLLSFFFRCSFFCACICAWICYCHARNDNLYKCQKHFRRHSDNEHWTDQWIRAAKREDLLCMCN